MPGIQNCNCLIHTIQVVPHSLFTPGVQLLVQENGALGASLFGVAELQVTLRVGDEFLGNRIGFFCCFITEYRLWLQEEKFKFENRLSIMYCLMFGYQSNCKLNLQMSLPKKPQKWDLSHSHRFPEKHCLYQHTSLYADAFVGTAVRILTRSVNWSSPTEVKLPSSLKWDQLVGTFGDHLVQIWPKAEITSKSELCPVKFEHFPGVDISQPLYELLKGLFFSL